MSLAVLADHMASRGRGPDSMLIHMSPREVQGLQALAMKHGGSLTINPDTGLPEAGFLDKLLPAVLGFALGPAGFALATPLQAAMVVGGIQAARTGDIGKGISAGLGAYGGAGLGAGISEAGASSIGAGEAAKGLTMTPDLANELMNAGAGETAAATNNALQQQVAERMASATPYERLSAGMDVAKANPMGMTKSLSTPLMMAAGPAIMAGANVQAKGPQTVTKPGMIRPYSFDPYGGTYTAGTPYEAAPAKAAEGGLMGLAAGGMAGYGDGDDVPRRVDNGMAQGGMYEFAQRSEPVLRMADGGIAGYAVGGAPQILSDEQLYQKTGSWEAAAAARDEQNRALNIYNDAQRLAAAVNPAPQAQVQTQAAPVNLGQSAADYVRSAATPTTTTEQFVTGAQQAGIGLTQPLQTALANSGLSAASQYALTHADIGSPLNTEETYGGLKGLSSNINYVAGGLQNLIGAGKLTGQGAREQALAEMNRYGINEADILRATGKSLKELFPDTVVKPTSVIPGGYYGNDTGNALTTTPGDIISNPDGTVTVVPNIPGRPEGGFTGMGQVRDVYTAGGGNLGYTPFVPKTIEEFESKYNKLTGGSKAAYDYLMGKTPYDPVPYTKTGEIMKPYWESVGRFPVNTATKKYIFKDGKYVLNPDYVKPPYVLAAEKAAASKETAKAGAAEGKFITVLNNQGDSEQAYMRDDGFYYTSSGNKFDEKGNQVAAGGGLMAMARGGATQYNLGDYSDGGRLLRGPGDGVSDSIPATIANKRPARLADGEFVVPARIVSELGNGSTEAGARKLYAMMDRIQSARRGTVGKGKVAKNSRADKHLPA